MVLVTANVAGNEKASAWRLSMMEGKLAICSKAADNYFGNLKI